MSDKFTEDYFLRGPETGLSNYTNYSWKGDLTLALADNVIKFLGVWCDASLLDFGCARGYVVRALRSRSIDAWGCDISEWAIENCDPAVRDYVGHKIGGPYDFVFSKDTLEHIPTEELERVLPQLLDATRRAALFVVPLVAKDGRYIYPADEQDSTHVQRLPLEGWMELIRRHAEGFAVFGSTTFHQLKPAAKQYPGSTGFIFCRKLV